MLIFWPYVQYLVALHRSFFNRLFLGGVYVCHDMNLHMSKHHSSCGDMCVSLMCGWYCNQVGCRHTSIGLQNLHISSDQRCRLRLKLVNRWQHIPNGVWQHHEIQELGWQHRDPSMFWYTVSSGNGEEDHFQNRTQICVGTSMCFC